MTPFQAIKATLYMLLAKAREPIQNDELIPVPTGAPHVSTRPEHVRRRPLELTQPRRRKTDWPSQHPSFVERCWKAIVAWVSSRT